MTPLMGGALLPATRHSPGDHRSPLRPCPKGPIAADIPAGRLLGVAGCVALGVVCAVLAMFTEQPSHQVLTREPLLFDPACLRDLTAEYRTRKRTYTALAVPATILFILGMLALAYTVRQDLPWSPYHALVFLALATGLLGFVYALGMLEAYELLVHNDQHTQTFLFRLRRKLRSKLDERQPPRPSRGGGRSS